MVLECTGFFTDKSEALKHVKAGAKKVLISAPSDNADATIVYGVNNQALKPEFKVISVGSCTTNCLAPVAKILNDAIGIEYGHMTTVHAFTSDQNLLDNSHKDLRRARSAVMSIVPTSTGAAKAIGLVIPELVGKFEGCAMRVPVPNVSCVDLNFIASRTTSKDEINKLMIEKVSSGLKNVLAVNDQPLVSIDFNHNIHSSIFDLTATKVIGGNLVHVIMWYDNEWGFANRMLDVAAIMV